MNKGDFMTLNLGAINDENLILNLKGLVKNEKALTHRILEYLREVENRKLFLARGYSSLYAFCTEALGYTEQESMIRIQAMRLVKTMPAVESKIKSGEISLSVAAQLQTSFRKENRRRAENGQPMLSFEEKTQTLQLVEKTSVRESQKKLAAVFPETRVKPDRIAPVSESQVRLEFVASKELADKLERLKGLLAHKNFDGNMGKLIELMADLALEKLTPKTPDFDIPQQRAQTVKSKSSRYISVQAKRSVWHQAQGRCQFKDPVTLKKCDSNHGLQYDHIHAFSKGGPSTSNNLQLLCAAHNGFKGDDLWPKDFIKVSRSDGHST
jgi:5-methylcytosine-specific restriction endonuclease McrA